MTFDAAPTDLSGKTCLVTGANGGIGQATAKHFAALGARVLTTDVGDAFGGDCPSDHRAFDLASDDGLAACCEWIAAEAPDVLFNNAALFDMGSVLQAGLDQYDRLFSVNVRAMYAVMQAVANTLVSAERPGSIINLASQAGHKLLFTLSDGQWQGDGPCHTKVDEIRTDPAVRSIFLYLADRFGTYDDSDSCVEIAARLKDESDFHHHHRGHVGPVNHAIDIIAEEIQAAVREHAVQT